MLPPPPSWGPVARTKLPALAQGTPSPLVLSAALQWFSWKPSLVTAGACSQRQPVPELPCAAGAPTPAPVQETRFYEQTVVLGFSLPWSEVAEFVVATLSFCNLNFENISSLLKACKEST